MRVLPSGSNRVPWIIGHRGAMGHAPENTLISFEKGWRLGADGLECDVHLSRDGRLVVIHDGTLERTTDGRGAVRRMDWGELRRLDAGAWYHPRFRGQRLLRLPDLLEWIRPKRSPGGRPLHLLVEIKSGSPRTPGVARRVVWALRAGGMLRRSWVISFDHDVVREVKRLCPRLPAGLIFHKRLPDLAARLRRAKADGSFPLWKLVNPKLVQRARRGGRFLGVWTVNDAKAMRRMIRLGVDAITTNYPDRLRRILKNTKFE